MPKANITPIELAKKYLIHIGVDKHLVERSLFTSLFEDSILCKKITKSDVVPQNKKGSGSAETHIYINHNFFEAFFSQAKLKAFNSARTHVNNQQSSQDILIFEANIFSSLQRRKKKKSSSLITKVPEKKYHKGSDAILSTTTTKWFNTHNGAIQLHIGQQEHDGAEFKDFRLGILISDYLIMLKYSNKDCILAISIPAEYCQKFHVTGTLNIDRTLSAGTKKVLKQYALNDAEYSAATDSTRIRPETTPLHPQPAPAGSVPRNSQKAKYKGNPSRGRGALDKAAYKCEYDNSHISFQSEKTGQSYMEPHHLIPISLQGYYKHDIDITSNLICLCPNCHKRIHYGTKDDVKKMLTKFHNARQADLKTCGIDIDLITLFAYYNI